MAIAILGVTPVAAFRQWIGYSTLMSSMGDSGALVVASGAARQRVEDRVLRANRLFKWVGLCSPVILLSIAAGLAAYAKEQHNRGVFGAAASSAVEAQTAYQSEWISPHANFPRFLILMSIAGLGLYVVSVQNIVGPYVIWTLWQCRRDLAFGADTVNADGFHGWMPVRKILDATFTEIGIHAIAILCVVLTLPPPGGSHIIFWFAFGEWIMTLPLYILFPIGFSRMFVSRYRESTIQRLLNEAESERRNARSNARKREIDDTYTRAIESIRAIPALPFKRTRELAIFTLSFVADLTAVVGVSIVLVRG